MALPPSARISAAAVSAAGTLNITAEVVDDDRSPTPGQFTRDAAAETAARTRYDRDLACEVDTTFRRTRSCHGLPRFWFARKSRAMW